MKQLQEPSVVYINTTKRMMEKGFKQISEIQPKSFIIERLEYWIDKFLNTYILELSKNGSVTIYKETKI